MINVKGRFEVKMRVKFKTAILLLLVLMILGSIIIFPDYSYGDDDSKNLVSIKTVNGKYLCAEDGGGKAVNATRDKVGDWETFEVIDLGRGYIALRSQKGNYIRGSKDGTGIFADEDEIGKRSKFQLIPLNNNKVAFKTYDDKYICAENGGGGKVVANRDKVGNWETFELVKIEQPKSDKSTLTANPGENGITFTWTKPINTKNIIGYNLYRGTAAGKQSSTPITDFPIESNSYTDKNINSDTTYYYILKTVYVDKSLGTASNEVSGKLIPRINLKAKTAENGVYLSWDKPIDTRDIIGYYLYRATTSGKQSSTPITDFPIEGTSYNDKNVERNTTYFYVLKVVYKDKTLGVLSNEVSAKSGSNTTTIVLEVGNKYMYVDGQRKEIDPGKGTDVVIQNGRTFLPIRSVIEAMGGEVEWRQSDKRVSIYLKDNVIHLWIGNKTAKVNGVSKETDVAPYISDKDRTMLPLRFIAENLDCDVNWDGLTKTVTITIKN